MVSTAGSVVAVEREIVGKEMEGLNDPADCCAASKEADAVGVGILVVLGDDEKNWAILLVALAVEEERLRVEAIIGSEASVLEEDEKMLGFRGIVSYWS